MTEREKQRPMREAARRSIAREQLRKAEAKADALTKALEAALKLRAAERRSRRPIRAGGNLRTRLARILGVAMPTDEAIAQAVVELVSKYNKLASKARGTLRMDLTPVLVRKMKRGAQ